MFFISRIRYKLPEEALTPTCRVGIKSVNPVRVLSPRKGDIISFIKMGFMNNRAKAQVLFHLNNPDLKVRVSGRIGLGI